MYILYFSYLPRNLESIHALYIEIRASSDFKLCHPRKNATEKNDTMLSLFIKKKKKKTNCLVLTMNTSTQKDFVFLCATY